MGAAPSIFLRVYSARAIPQRKKILCSTRPQCVDLVSPMKVINWRWFLAVGQVVLALDLLIVGHLQERAHHAELERKVSPGWQLRTESDYIPRAKIWLLTINSPPSLLSMPFVALVAKFKFAPQFVFLLAVALFWYWTGSVLDKRAKPAPVPASVRARRGALWMQVAGLLCCVILFGIGVWGFFAGGLPVIIRLSDVLWSLILGFYFAKELTRQRAAPATTA